MKVLVVDDSLTMRKIVSNCLKVMGLENVVQAVDGMDALEKLQANADVEIILCDWNMPNLNGFEFLVKMRENEANKGIIFIMVTTESEKESVVKAIKAGANNYVLKPFTPEALKDKVQQTLKKFNKAIPSK
jgi:two-component system chemotaxis response regulator CheY